MGKFAIPAAITAPNISVLSPNTTTKFGCNASKASAKPEIAKAILFEIPTEESDESKHSTFLSTTKPASVISFSVYPNSGERCIPVAISCSCKSLSLAIKAIKGLNNPNSALVPVTTQIFLIILFIPFIR